MDLAVECGAREGSDEHYMATKLFVKAEHYMAEHYVLSLPLRTSGC